MLAISTTTSAPAALAAPDDEPSAQVARTQTSRWRQLRAIAVPRWVGSRSSPPRPSPPAVVFASTSLLILAALALALVAQLTFLGALEHNRAQIVAADALRFDLANATAPVGPLDDRSLPLSHGTPVALLEIPSLGVREVVDEGTSSGVTMAGPGHRRDSALPGQAGVSVVVGRSSAFGAPFAGIRQLHAGDSIVTITGQGKSEFEVIGVRRAGEPLPQPLDAGAARLLLVSADGAPFEPTGVVMVDARAVSRAFVAGPQLGSSYLAPEERVMAGDITSDNLFPLVLWTQLLLVMLGALVWSALRWGRWQTWLVGVPAVFAVGLAVVDHLCRMLPNLL